MPSPHISLLETEGGGGEYKFSLKKSKPGKETEMLGMEAKREKETSRNLILLLALIGVAASLGVLARRKRAGFTNEEVDDPLFQPF